MLSLIGAGISAPALANDGRALSWGDVNPKLVAIDVYKASTADLISTGINLAF